MEKETLTCCCLQIPQCARKPGGDPDQLGNEGREIKLDCVDRGEANPPVGRMKWTSRRGRLTSLAWLPGVAINILGLLLGILGALVALD